MNFLLGLFRTIEWLFAVACVASLLLVVWSVAGWALERLTENRAKRRYRQGLADLQRQESLFRRREAFARFQRTGHGKG